ncbi:MAG: hypothetical protein R3A11_04765 [Bdellovibrionota bacterium]
MGLQTIDSKKEDPSKEEIAWNQKMDKLRAMPEKERILHLREEMNQRIDASFDELGIQDPAFKGKIKDFEPSSQQLQKMHQEFDEGLRAFIDDGRFLTPEEANQRWGRKSFDPSAFASSKDVRVRGPMAVDLIEKKIFLGKSLSELQGVLGDEDGIFLTNGFRPIT